MVPIVLLLARKMDLHWEQHRKDFVINLWHTYKGLMRKRRANIILLLVVCLLLQKLSFSATLESRLEGRERTVYAHIFMSVLPEEEVSGIQLECVYNMQSWELISAFPGEILYASEKQLQIAPGYGALRILIVGFNNYPIVSGELFTLQFNTLTDGVDKLGFRILSVKLSSPFALPVNGTIGNKEEEESSTDSEYEKESDTGNTANATLVTETPHQTYTNLPTMTNPVNVKPNAYGRGESSIPPTYSQLSSTKSYNSILSSGYFPEINNPYIHNRRHQENNKKEIQTNISNSIHIFPKPPIIETRNIFNNRMVLTNQIPNSSNKNVKTIPVIRNAQNQRTMTVNTLGNSSPDNIKLSTIRNNIATHKLSGNINDTSCNTYLALNVSNLSSIRERSNECTQATPTNLLIDHTFQKENTLILLVSMIITVLGTLTLISMLLKKSLFLSKGKSEK